MIDSVALTRKGYVKHLELIQGMLDEVGEIVRNVHASFSLADCEHDRSAKIGKDLLKLKELVWEACAVSERIDREDGAHAPVILAYPRDIYDSVDEGRRKSLHDAAKELAALARSVYDPTAGEVVQPEVLYPGGRQGGAPAEDPNQTLLPFSRGEPPQVDPKSLLDYKSKQANDDTNGDGEEDGDGDE